MKQQALILLLISSAALGQGTFQNLDFESATIVPISSPPGPLTVEFAPAFPGWTGYIGTNQTSSAIYDGAGLDTTTISIIDQGWTNAFGFGGVIDGNYTAVLAAGVIGSVTNPVNATLSQTAVLPGTVRSLRFLGYSFPFQAFFVTVNGQRLSLIALSSGANYTEYGADISAWAGQSANLSFTAVAPNPHSVSEYLFLDDIEFSPTAVPEPNTLTICGLGAALVGWRRCKTRVNPPCLENRSQSSTKAHFRLLSPREAGTVRPFDSAPFKALTHRQ